MATLPEKARVVVIGGGVTGANMLFQLTERGCTDAILLEKSELSAGTTWGSSALITHFGGSPTFVRLHAESIDLYRRLEEMTGQSTGLHITGSLRFAETEERLTEYRRCQALAQHLGLGFEIVDTDRIKALHPYVSTDGLLAAAYTPEDGYIDPSSVTQALAQAARTAGAVIHRGVMVRDLRQAANRTWEVITDEGTVRADHVVNAAGMWGPALGRMVGQYHPIVAFERQYFVTEDIPALEEPGRARLPVLRDPEGTFYAREEIAAFLIGPYERQPLFWGLDGIPEGFAHESLPPFLDQATEPVEAALARLPILNEVGIRATVNVPTCRTPDLFPLVGPVRGLEGYWVAAGFFGGISESVICRPLAAWILDGDPGANMSQFDPRRFAGHVGQRYTVDRIKERHIIGLVQAVGYPHEELANARPAKTGPIYDAQAARGAVFGLRAGWEVPLWFAPHGVEPRDELTFRRANWFPHVGAECRAATESAGLADQSAVTRVEISGPGAAAFLARVSASLVPATDGEVKRALFLSPAGLIATLATLTRLAADRYYLTAPITAEVVLLDLLERHLADGDGVSLSELTGARGTLSLVGPKARDVLSRLTEVDLSPNAFPLGTAREAAVGYAPALLVRGESLGVETWEIHHGIAYQRALFAALHEAGDDVGLADIGLRAQQSLLLEIGAAPGTAIGMSPAAAGLTDGHSERRLTLLAIDATDADAYGAEPVFHGEDSVALVAAGGYGHRMETSLAMAALPRALAAPGTELAVTILGERRPARVIEVPACPPAASP